MRQAAIVTGNIACNERRDHSCSDHGRIPLGAYRPHLRLDQMVATVGNRKSGFAICAGRFRDRERIGRPGSRQLYLFSGHRRISLLGPSADQDLWRWIVVVVRSDGSISWWRNASQCAAMARSCFVGGNGYALGVVDGGRVEPMRLDQRDRHPIAKASAAPPGLDSILAYPGLTPWANLFRASGAGL